MATNYTDSTTTDVSQQIATLQETKSHASVKSPEKPLVGDNAEQEELAGTSSPVSKSDEQATDQVSAPPPHATGPPGSVDEGLRCWLQVVGAFGMWTNVRT